MIGIGLGLRARGLSRGKNLLTWSEDFTNAAYTASGLAATPVIANTATAPDGTVTADSIVEDSSTTGVHYRARPLSGVLSAGQTYNLSVYAKADTTNWIILVGNGGSAFTYFNLAAGTKHSSGGLAAGGTNYMVPDANGFYRCGIDYTYGAGTDLRLYLATSDGGASFLGTGRKFFAWGIQITPGIGMKRYRATQGTAFP